ncbi:hypothetical protein GQ600_20527 [Phytophthora cactorum]|nr:hypothetical protein GQ600_20527 [Phytophthora cactorum]
MTAVEHWAKSFISCGTLSSCLLAVLDMNPAPHPLRMPILLYNAVAYRSIVRRPCGRPPAVTQQLRSLAANSLPRQSNRAGAAEPPSAARRAPAPPRPSPSGAASAPAARQNPAPTLCLSSAPATGQSPAPPKPSPAGASPVLSSSNAEQAVASMFADVSRAAIAHPGDSPHLNVAKCYHWGSLHCYARLVTSMQETFSLTLERV